jgi:3-dehydroquinate dehydratase/shikimate dehydrogenase
MLFVSINTPSYSAARDLISKLGPEVDGIELRLDCFETVDPAEVEKLIDHWQKPVMLTVRKFSHGGSFAESEQVRESLIRELFALHPHFFDLECDTSAEFVNHLRTEHPEVNIVCSYHNFQETPDDLEGLFAKMQSSFPAYAYKIATMALSTADALRMVLFTRDVSSQGQRIIGIAMGEIGQPTRILGPVMGNCFDYAPSTQAAQTAPGQIAYFTLLDTFRYKKLNKGSSIYGLIGNPIDKSLSHLTHNRVFSEFDINAVYIKMRVKENELAAFFHGLKLLPFKGLSVTMPLKESLERFVAGLGESAKKIGAINTLVRREDGWWGYNTDGVGALNAIEAKMRVIGKKIVVIGTGGASKAIIFEAKERGATVIIAGRNKEKREELAAFFGCATIELSKISEHSYDILINATPVGMSDDQLPIDASAIREGTLVMDVVAHPIYTPLLKEAEAKKCILVLGQEMWVYQAIEQFLLWFPNLDRQKIQNTLRDH